MANDDSLMSQDEIERLFSQTKLVPGTPGGPAGTLHPGSTKAARPGVPGAPAPARGHDVPMTGGKDDSSLAQDDIEKLLNEGAGSLPATVAGAPGTPGPAAAPAPPPHPEGTRPGTLYPGEAATQPSREPDIAAQDIEYLLAQAEKALESVNSGRLGEIPTGVSSYRLNEFAPATPSQETATLDLIRNVELDLKIELGRTHMYLEDVLKLRKGSVVPLDKLAGDPVDIYVNGRLIARGEVLVLNDNFCVRVAELIVGANVFS